MRKELLVKHSWTDKASQLHANSSKKLAVISKEVLLKRGSGRPSTDVVRSALGLVVVRCIHNIHGTLDVRRETECGVLTTAHPSASCADSARTPRLFLAKPGGESDATRLVAGLGCCCSKVVAVLGAWKESTWTLDFTKRVNSFITPLS
jgi:hypothetical protein